MQKNGHTEILMHLVYSKNDCNILMQKTNNGKIIKIVIAIIQFVG
jgi:hypothetical protein